MISIKNNFTNITPQITALPLFVKATYIYTAYTSLFASILKINGLHDALNTPLTALTRRIEFITDPLIEINDLFIRTLGYITPPIYFNSNEQIRQIIPEDCYSHLTHPPEYACRLLNRALWSAFTEELLIHGLLQRILLPQVARLLPARLEKSFNHKITRIALTSLIFASAHKSEKSLFYFILGMSLGTTTELTQSLKLPMLVHFMHNALVIYKNPFTVISNLMRNYAG